MKSSSRANNHLTPARHRTLFGLKSLRAPLPTSYDRAEFERFWLDVAATGGRDLDSKLRALVQRSYELGCSAVAASLSRTERAEVDMLNSSILTGYWVSLTAGGRAVSVREFAKSVRRSMHRLASVSGRHHRYVIFVGRTPDGHAHAHLIIEESWVRDGKSVAARLVDLLPDCGVFIEPFVTGGGAIEYVVAHKKKLSFADREDYIFEPRIACPGGSICPRFACTHRDWGDPRFREISRYDVSALPARVTGWVSRSRWYPRRVPEANRTTGRDIRAVRAFVQRRHEALADFGVHGASLPEQRRFAPEIRRRRRELLGPPVPRRPGFHVLTPPDWPSAVPSTQVPEAPPDAAHRRRTNRGVSQRMKKKPR